MFHNELSSKNVCVIFDNSLGGGAAFFRNNIIQEMFAGGFAVVLVIYDFKSFNFKIHILNGKEERKPITIYEIKAVIDLMNYLHLSNVIINNLVSYQEISNFVDCIKNLKVKKAFRLILPIHDFFYACPSYNLIDWKGRFCKLPDADTCQKCLESNTLDTILNFTGDITNWRRETHELLIIADEIRFFSESSKALFLKAFPLLKNSDLVTIPHNSPNPLRRAQILQDDILTIGIPGYINFPKGSEVVIELSRALAHQKLSNIRLVVIGELIHSKIPANIIITGKYDRRVLPEIIEKHNVDVILIPSICPETFSFTLEEAIAMRLPTAVFALGAQAARASKYEMGIVLQSMEPNYIIKEINQFLK